MDDQFRKEIADREEANTQAQKHERHIPLLGWCMIVFGIVVIGVAIVLLVGTQRSSVDDVGELPPPPPVPLPPSFNEDEIISVNDITEWQPTDDPLISIASMSFGDRRIALHEPRISFTIEPEWNIASQSDVIPSPFEAVPIMVIQNNEVACDIHVFDSDDISFDKIHTDYQQTSWADRVFMRVGYTSGDWYTPRENVPVPFKFSEHQRQYLPGEFAIYPLSGGSDGGVDFVLTTPDSSPVPGECYDDLRQLVTAALIEAEFLELDEQSEGFLYIDNRYVPHSESVKDYDEIERYFLFRSVEVPELEFRVAQVSGSPIVVHNNIIHLNGGDDVYQFDPFTLQKTPLSLLENTQDRIADYIFEDGDLYYTAGNEECVYFGGEECVFTLYRKDMTTNQTEVLAEIAYPYIEGVTAEKDAIGLVKGYGDAGCFSAYYEEYSLLTGEVSEVDQLSGCTPGTVEYDSVEEEQADARAVLRLEELRARYQRGNAIEVPYVFIQDGAVGYSEYAVWDEFDPSTDQIILYP